MRIKANHGSYWRGATFNRYTGRGWTTTFDQIHHLSPSGGGGFSEDIFVDPNAGPPLHTFLIPANLYNMVGAGAHTMEQRVRFVGNGLFNDIYAAPEIRELRMSEPTAQTDEVGSIRLLKTVQQTEYSARSVTRILRHYGRRPSHTLRQLRATI